MVLRPIRSRLLIVIGLLIWAAAVAPVIAAEPTPPGRIPGRVVDPEGRPIPGALVFGAFDRAEAEIGRASEQIHRTETDGQGRFDLAWPDLTGGRGIPAVWVHHAGSRLARATVEVPPAGGIVRVVLHPIVRSAAASVEVVDPRGDPVDRARIVPTRWFESDFAASSGRVWEIPSVLGALLATRTDEQGRATLDTVAALRLAAVAVESSLGSQVASWDETLVARHRIVKLRPVGRVTGRVLSSDPAAVVGLTISLTSVAGDREVARVTATTDESGRFEARDVAAGAVEVRVEPRAGAVELPAKGRPPAARGGVVGSMPRSRSGVGFG